MYLQLTPSGPRPEGAGKDHREREMEASQSEREETGKDSDRWAGLDSSTGESTRGGRVRASMMEEARQEKQRKAVGKRNLKRR